jgi:hypothetical protein
MYLSEWLVCQFYRWAAFWERLAIAIDRGLLAYLTEKRLQQLHEPRSETSRFLRGAPAEAHQLADLKLDEEAAP